MLASVWKRNVRNRLPNSNWNAFYFIETIWIMFAYAMQCNAMQLIAKWLKCKVHTSNLLCWCCSLFFPRLYSLRAKIFIGWVASRLFRDRNWHESLFNAWCAFNLTHIGKNSESYFNGKWLLPSSLRISNRYLLVQFCTTHRNSIYWTENQNKTKTTTKLLLFLLSCHVYSKFMACVYDFCASKFWKTWNNWKCKHLSAQFHIIALILIFSEQTKPQTHQTS